MGETGFPPWSERAKARDAYRARSERDTPENQRQPAEGVRAEALVEEDRSVGQRDRRIRYVTSDVYAAPAPVIRPKKSR